ncbi:hypothetical protein KI387_010519, partial [Taxus chinensis]
AKLIRYPITKPFVKGEAKPCWYKPNTYCEFHRIDGHHIDKCVRFKNYVQDLIDDEVISVELDDNALATNDTSNTTTFHEELTTVETHTYTEIPRDHDNNSQDSLIPNQSISSSNFLPLVQTYIELVLDNNILPTSIEHLNLFQDTLSSQTYIEPVLDNNILPTSTKHLNLFQDSLSAQTYIEPVLDDNILLTSNETLISFQDSLSNLDITVDTTDEVPSTSTI